MALEITGDTKRKMTLVFSFSALFVRTYRKIYSIQNVICMYVQYAKFFIFQYTY